MTLELQTRPRTTVTVRSGRPLVGTVRVDGSKNAALPLVAAIGRPVQLANVPRSTDAQLMVTLLKASGFKVTSRQGGLEVVPNLGAVLLPELPEGRCRAPEGEFDALAPALDRSEVPFSYTGWLDRRRKWEIFADYDLLLSPPTALEAMGRVALEAQACGLPVIYQPVPGLIDALGDSALATDFTEAAAVTKVIDRLKASAALRAELRDHGRANAARYPLSRTAAALAELGRQLTSSCGT